MSLLFETISIRNGQPENLFWHQARMDRSVEHCLGIKNKIELTKVIKVPEYAQSGHFRCRIDYSTSITRIEYSSYTLADISSLKVVDIQDYDYSFKFADRNMLNEFLKQKEECDDVLLVKNACITDSSYANIVFWNGKEWITPDTPLLKGTCRARMLASGVIREKRILTNDLKDFLYFRLINVLRGFQESPDIQISAIRR